MDYTAETITRVIGYIRQFVLQWVNRTYHQLDNYELSDITPVMINPLTAEVNTFMREWFPTNAIVGYIQGESDTDDIHSHTMRRFYANYSFRYYAIGMVSNVWIQSVLGHDTSSLTTSLSYSNATIADPLTFRNGGADADGARHADSAVVNILHQMNKLQARFDVIEEVLYDFTTKNKQSVIAYLNVDEFDVPVAYRVKQPKPKLPKRIISQAQMAKIVRKYAERNTLFPSDDGYDYSVSITTRNLIACGFPLAYAKAFFSEYKDDEAIIRHLQYDAALMGPLM